MKRDQSSHRWLHRCGVWFFKYIALALLFSLFGALSYCGAGPLLYGKRQPPQSEFPEWLLLFSITLWTLRSGFWFGLCTAIIVCPLLALHRSTAVPKKWICISLGSVVVFMAILRRFDLNYSWVEFVSYFPAACALLLCVLAANIIKQATRPGHCAHCDYNLTGNVSGICPECGTAISPATSAMKGSAVSKRK